MPFNQLSLIEKYFEQKVSNICTPRSYNSKKVKVLLRLSSWRAIAKATLLLLAETTSTSSGADPKIASYNASVVKTYSATRFPNKKLFLRIVKTS
jgi:hypothetical protein